MPGIIRSLRDAARGFRRRPGFFAIAVSSLAIALGLATTVIAQIDSLMHPYSPIKDVERLYRIHWHGTGVTGNPRIEDFLSELRGSGLFDDAVPSVEGFGEIAIGQGITGVGIQWVGRELFLYHGVQPRLGRVFSPDESVESGVAVVSDDIWKRFFDNAPSIGRASFTYRERIYNIIGVLPAGYHSWYVSLPLRGHDVKQVYADGRLKRGIRSGQADTLLESISDRWISAYGRAPRTPFALHVLPLRPNPLRIGDFQRAMIGAALFILVIASANVSALMMARGVARRRDHALRLALGARRFDLLRDVAAEILIIAGVGAAAGISVAFAAMGIMTRLTPVEVTWLGFLAPNWSPRVFVGMFGAMIVAIMIAAFAPAWHVMRIAPAEPLKEASGTTTGRSSSRFQVLVVGELALALILLLGASLIAKTAWRIQRFEFGFDAQRVTALRTGVAVVQKLSLPVPADSVRFRRRPPEILWSDLEMLLLKLRTQPDVVGAAWMTSDAADREIVVSDETGILDTIVYMPRMINTGPGFLAAVGIALLEGRDFAEGDPAAGGAVILDERSAKRLFPSGRAVGGMVKLGPYLSNNPWVRVVGIARNAAHELPEYAELDLLFVIYVSRDRSRGFFPTIAIRARANAVDITPMGLRVGRDLLPPRSGVAADPWLRGYNELLAGRRFTAWLFATMSAASLLLATAGLFGVLSYAVNQRMREFAVRVAIGARARDILRLVFRDALVMALGGTAVGGIIGLWAAFSVYDWLWGVYPVDAPALVIAELVLLAVTLCASMLPALRAARANPVDVMRAN